jgi:peptidoglycan hydrolase-like protein with peptidoglycan-binding domain
VGKNNQDAIKAQACLSLMNYPIGNTGNNGVDGKIGSMTKGAIRAFQRMSGLEVTGELNEETLIALNEAAISGKTIRDLAMSAHERGVEFEISKNSTRADFVNAVY